MQISGNLGYAMGASEFVRHFTLLTLCAVLTACGGSTSSVDNQTSVSLAATTPAVSAAASTGAVTATTPVASSAPEAVTTSVNLPAPASTTAPAPVAPPVIAPTPTPVTSTTPAPTPTPPPPPTPVPTPAPVIKTPGTLALTASTNTVAQSAGSITLTVTRTGGSDGAASISYTTSDITAVAGTNYTKASGTLQWATGDAASKSVAVTLNSTGFTGTKSFKLTLSAAGGAALGSPAITTVTITGSGAVAVLSPAAALAAKLKRPKRLLIGVGAQGPQDQLSVVESQADQIDIYEHYLGTGDWTSWNAPPCDFVCVVAGQADAVGAVPMFTQYQMANDGDGNLAPLNDASFMNTYWARVKLLYQDIAAYGKPALVNLEPDFWGYAERQAPNGDPTRMTALVKTNPDCATLHNDITGVAGCLIAMARKYAPNAYVGFPPSNWGGDTTAQVVAFMNAIGAQHADFITEQTLDRDGGCFELSPQPSFCSRSGTGWYWDESNQTHPNFQDHLSEAAAYHTGIGNLPLIWWQTPQGVPSTTPGGTAYHYRDNRMHYFLTHPAELVAAGGLGVVFSTGEDHQTNIATDGGQFQLLDSQYHTAPAALP